MESIIVLSMCLCLAVTGTNAQDCAVPDQDHGLYAPECNAADSDDAGQTVPDGTSCMLRCNDGFDVNQQSHITFTCTAGVLDPDQPMCEEKCTLPEAVNGEYSEGCDIDTGNGENMISSGVAECKLNCNTGYKVSGASFKQVTCADGAIMQTPDAECKESDDDDDDDDGAMSVTYSYVMMTFAMMISICIIGVF